MSFPAAPQVASLGANIERLVLKHYAALLWRWSWLIVLCATLAGAAAFGVSAQTQPVYQSSTSLLINQARAANSGPDYTSLLTAERLAKTYAELMRKRPALDAVIANLKLDGDAEALAKRVSVSPVRDTQLLVLTVEDTDPQRAADIANQIVKVFAEQNQALQASHYGDTKQSLERELAKIQLDIDTTQAGLAGLKSTGAADVAARDRLQTLLAQYRSNYASLLKSLGDVQLAETQSTDSVNVAEAARPESLPVRPRTLLNTLLGVIVGILLGIGMVFLVEYLDDRVKSSDQVAELTGLMTLGTIGRIQETGARNSLVTIRNPRSPAAESYRMLRVNLDFSAIDRPLRTIAITSSGPAEGKTTTIANLAVAIAQTGKRVIVVDTDLRRPTLHKVFHLPNERGVTTALLNPGEGGIKSHLIRSGIRNLLVMTCGPIPPNPAELLGSQRMAKLIDDLKGHADVVLFDTPPLLVFADAALLAGICDGTLLVVRAGFTRTGALARAREQFAQSGARLLGVALNRAMMPRGSYDSYYYYYAEPTNGQGKPRRAGSRRWPFIRAPKHAQPAASSALEYIEFSEGVAPANGDHDVAGLNDAYEMAALPALATNGAGNGNGGNGHATPELADTVGAPQSAASKWRVIYPREK
jgi:non-specific protein-tyrosine kinase